MREREKIGDVRDYKHRRVACPNCAVTSTKKGYTIMEAMDIWDQL